MNKNTLLEDEVRDFDLRKFLAENRQMNSNSTTSEYDLDAELDSIPFSTWQTALSGWSCVDMYPDGMLWVSRQEGFPKLLEINWFEDEEFDSISREGVEDQCPLKDNTYREIKAIYNIMHNLGWSLEDYETDETGLVKDIWMSKRGYEMSVDIRDNIEGYSPED